MTDVLDVAEVARPTPRVGDEPVIVETTTRFDLALSSRILLAAVSAGAGAIHLAMVPSHWGDSAVEGLGFAVAGWLQLAFAVLIVWRPTRAVLGAGVALNAVAIGAWVVSRTAGLPFGAHSGEAESAGFLDVTCVAFEAFLVLACLVLLFHPRIGMRHVRAGMFVSIVAGLGVLALTTAALASPGARNHGHGHAEGTTAAGTGDGHTHPGDAGAAPVDDKGFSSLHNGQHDHSTMQHTLDGPTQELLDHQLELTRTVARRTPTVAAAEKIGYKRVGPYFPGIGAHYWTGIAGGIGGPAFNPDGVMDDNDIEHPLMLIFDGTKPTSKMTGFMYYSFAGSEPPGFAGRNDTWHYHESLCIKLKPNGEVDVPYGLDHSATDEQCEAAGAQMIRTSNYMVHVWSVPGYEMPLNYGGVFGESNPKLACADGTYYMLPVEEWVDHPMNVCQAQ